MNLPPPVTRNLLIAMVVVFILQHVFEEPLLLHFALWPWGDFPVGTDADGMPVTAGFQPWQLITYAFLHDTRTLLHLLFNGIALYQFGGRIEQTLGPRRFTTYFFVCVAGAGLCQLLVTSLMVNSGGDPFPTLGASGGVFGLLLAYGMMFPRDQMILFPIPKPISARTMVIIFGVAEIVFGVSGTLPGVAHFAHLGGMLFGWLMLRYWRGLPPFRRRRPPGPRLVR